MLFITSPVAANEADTDIETVVVTGTRATGILSEIPNTTTVIDLQQIEARNAVSFVDLLQNLPGIHVVQPSGQGGVSRVFLREGIRT